MTRAIVTLIHRDSAEKNGHPWKSDRTIRELNQIIKAQYPGTDPIPAYDYPPGTQLSPYVEMLYGMLRIQVKHCEDKVLAMKLCDDIDSLLTCPYEFDLKSILPALKCTAVVKGVLETFVTCQAPELTRRMHILLEAIQSLD